MYALDISPKNIAAAARLATKHGYEKRIHLSVQSAERMSYPDGILDVVLGVDILHHIEIEAAIEAVAIVLRPSGVGIFCEYVEVKTHLRAEVKVV